MASRCPENRMGDRHGLPRHVQRGLSGESSPFDEGALVPVPDIDDPERHALLVKGQCEGRYDKSRLDMIRTKGLGHLGE